MTNKFLNKLKKEKKLELVEPSADICESYSGKSANCFKSAKLLLQNNLYENSIGMSYYAMYNQLTALLFMVGIKCENHAGSILLLKILFDKEELFKLISDAKKERIDKQYYVALVKDGITKEIAEELLNNTQNFILKIKVVIQDLNSDSIGELRGKLKAEIISKTSSPAAEKTSSAIKSAGTAY